MIRAAACDRNIVNRTKRLDEIGNMTEGGTLLSSQGHSVLQLLSKCEPHDDEMKLWMKFVELSHTLDTRDFYSRSDRAFVDEASQIISLQQAELSAVRGVNGGYAGVEVKERQILTSNKLWDLTKMLVELIKTKTDGGGVPYDHCLDPDTTTLRVNVVDNIVDLESLLRAKGITGLRCGSSDPVLDDEDASLSAIELLSSSCTSPDGLEVISSDMLEKAFDELSAIKQLGVISIQASFLLGLQMRLKVCFLDRFESAKDEFERRIRRVFNCLTDKAHDTEHVASLVILSAFCPSQVIRQLLLGARADVLHHSLYVEVLRASPLLLNWTKDAEYGSETVLECDLQQAVLDVSSTQSNFDRESQNMMSFLLSVVGIPTSSSSKREAPVMTINNLLDKVINPVCCATGLSISPHLYLYTFIQQLFQHFVTLDMCRDLDHTSLECSFNLISGALCSFNASDLRLGVLVRERLLLLLKNIMELMPDPASVIMVKQLDTPLNPSLWTLLIIFDSDLISDEFCKGLEDVALVESFMQRKPTGDLQLVLPLPTVISAIQVLLWGLLWDTTLPVKLKVKSTKAEAWSLVDSIAWYEFLGSESTDETTAGALLIRSAIAEIMLECGSDLFQALLSKIIPYLLEYESETSAEDRLVQPKWAAVKLSKLPEMEQQISCGFVSTHSIMRYVAKCWGLSAAVNIQLATQENVLLLHSLSHVLAAYDPAITSSQGSLSGTLFCIQWLCFLASTTHDMHLDKMLAWPTVRTQLELLLLRLLHQLEQLKEISTSEARFSQYFVAAWLAYLPAGQFDQVFNFVASRTRT
ncbi:unnamed protein product [Peronospora farinosa]|uniref:Uncharacterized protein n=1 Tax=Peronospora farinosa TaxID=134698 RepID=A0AAV0UGE4_9STRA|nr:unnamed protein product [Peronospora farinosa]